jgi:hypothetical protein
MKKSIRAILGLGLLGVMLATTVPSFAAPQSKAGKKKGGKKGGSKGKSAQKKGGHGTGK